ncbi:MAG: hypothetical protein GX868_10555 [Actinobacteria bacterium]|nr:hypothetical protein [Actinomycetota bacterium]
MAVASSARARARTTAPAQPPRRRPEFHVIERAERVRRARPLVVIAVAVFAATAFGALAMQISMINRQQSLDTVRSEINEIQEENKTLRQRESLLQAPAEILRIAEAELGMVKARDAEIVVPAKRVIGTPPATNGAGSAVSVSGTASNTTASNATPSNTTAAGGE